RLEWVVGPGRDRLAGQLTGPVRVRHVPGRVDLLVLDVVQAGRRFEALLADGDRVCPGQLEVLEQAQLEGGAVDDDVARVLRAEVVLGDVGTQVPHRDAHAVRAG